MKWKHLIAGLVMVAMLAACSSQKGPASSAIAAAEMAVASIQDDAARFLPDELQAVEASLSRLKSDLAKGEYKAVVANAASLNDEVDALKAKLATKLDEARVATVEWTELLRGCAKDGHGDPDEGGVAVRFEEPASGGLNKDSFESVKSELGVLKGQWAEASGKFEGGNAIAAMATAREAKAKAEGLMKQLGLKLG